ncbi:alpha/beta hydrolase family protein [Novipirellula sp. SH528]|uniref:alpha/beta hydrolase family protein n=1 Tax=Novipirellula sp. SH528 TaxID=3454466 RepID=UPI003F9F7DFA
MKRVTCCVGCAILMFTHVATATDNDGIQVEAARRSLPRDVLLEYHDDNGIVRPAKSIAQWQRRRDEIVAAMESVMGTLPAGDALRSAPLVHVIEEVDCGSYVRRQITYQSEPHCQTPAYLCIPKTLLNGDTKGAAVLCLHPTDSQIGYGVVVGLGGKANRQYAMELAERGFVTLSPSYPLLANYQPDFQAGGWQSGTLKAVWDNLRGIDLLQSLLFVDEQQIGAIGHSLGGHNSVYTAVFDPRIKAIISSCGLDSYVDYSEGDPAKWLPEQGWTQTRYMPRLRDYRGRLEEIPFDFHEMIAALAPRPVLIVAPTDDSNFRADSVDRIVAAARPVYQLYGKADRLQVRHPNCAHDFPDEMRELAYRFLKTALSSQESNAIFD